MPSRRVTLPLLQQAADSIDETLARPLQQLALSSSVGSPDHRGLVHLAATLAQHAIDSCLPPAARSQATTCLGEVRRWCAAPFAIRSRALSNDTVSAIPAARAATAAAVTRMLQVAAPAGGGALQPHANHVIVRHATMATYYAVGSVVLTLDALDRPQWGSDVPAQVAGALAHRAIWLSCARDDQLQREAWEQATWLREQDTAGDTTDALALQLFHEFLGVTWKAQRDAHASRLFAFVDWALAR